MEAERNMKHSKSMLREFNHLKRRSLFAIHDSTVVKLLTRLWFRFSHLNEHNFHDNFKDVLSPLCDCGSETETTNCLFLHFPFFTKERKKFVNSLFEILI